MKKSLVLFAAMAASNAMPVNAAVITLFDWGVNIDGGTTCPAGDPCDTDILPAAVDGSGFDFTAGLGTISYTITGSGDHHTSLFLDHEIDEDFENEFGSTTGALAAGQTWEIDQPVNGDIFISNFLDGNETVGSQLDMINGVPLGSENDVAMALAWDFTLGAGIGAGETATVDFMVSLVAPTDGSFFLSLTDPDATPEAENTIYFSSTLDIQPNPVPVPGALLLFGSGLVGLVGTCFRRKSQKVKV